MRFSTTTALTGGCWIGVISRFGVAAVLGITTSAWGATPITGPITSNTSWSASGSPYVLSGDVQVQNGAHLDIAAGVTVQMNAGAALTISSGTLTATGTAADPIIVTSASTTPARGDWQALTFSIGASSDSILSHVNLRYGHGVVIEAGSPTFNDVTFENNIGAAITLADLGASPRGSGLGASGNDINGILVPAGAIHADTHWTATGIPYVLAQGTLEVGSRPFGFVPSTLHVVAGQSDALTLNVPSAAPAGGLAVALASSASSAVQVDASVTIPEGEYSVQVPVHAASLVQSTSATITATAAPNYSGTATVIVDPLPTLQLQPSSMLLGVNQTASMSVKIPNASASTDTVVTLGASDANIQVTPASVTIAHGTTSATFSVKGITASASVSTVLAHATGYNDASAAVGVHDLRLSAPANAFVAPGASSHITVSLGSDPAPAGGLTVQIDNANTAALLVGDPPPNQTQLTQIVVPQGASSVDVPIYGVDEAAGTVALTFSDPAVGYHSAVTQVAVRRISATLGNGSAVQLVEGRSVTLSVNLSAEAPPGGVTLALTSSMPESLTVSPGVVTVQAGAKFATTQVTLEGLHAAPNAAIALQSTDAPGIDGYVAVAVTPRAQLYFSRAKSILAKGFVSSGYRTYVFCAVDNSGCNLPYAVDIDLASAATDRVTVPAHIVLPAHQSSVEFVAQAIDLTTSDVPLTASTTTPGVAAPVDPFLIQVVPPQLRFDGIGDRSRAVGEARKSATVSVYADGGDDVDIGNPGKTLALSVSNAIVDGLFAGESGGSAISQLSMPAGYRDASFWIGSPTSAGDYSIHATLDGVEFTSPLQHVVQPGLAFNSSGLSLGLGLTAQRIAVSFTADGATVCGGAPVTLASSDTSKVTVTAELSEDGCVTRAFIHGVALTNGQPITITATPQGSPGLTATLAVEVEPARIRFVDLEGHRFPNSSPDYFYIRWDGTGGGDFYNNGAVDFTADVDHQVSVAVTDATTGVLPTPSLLGTTTVTVPAGSAGYEGFSVAAPAGIGHYRIAATLDGSPAGESELQTVGRVWMSIGSYGMLGAGFSAIATLHYVEGGAPPPSGPLNVLLTSRAPDFVHVPTSVTIDPSISTDVEFPVTGVSPTSDLGVLIDAQVEGDTDISNSMGITVLEPQLEFRMDLARAVDGPEVGLGLAWNPSFRCDFDNFPDPQGGRNCYPEQTLAAEQTFTLAIESDGELPIVSGFLNDAEESTDQLTFPQGYDPGSNEPVDAGGWVGVSPPQRIGTYRVRATLGTNSWLSDEVVVGIPVLTFSTSHLFAGLHMRSDTVLQIRRGISAQGPDGPQIIGAPAADDVHVNLTCEPVSQCPIDLPCETGGCGSGMGHIVLPAFTSEKNLTIAGTMLGTATITATTTSASSSQPLTVEVVKPSVHVTLTPSPMQLSLAGSPTGAAQFDLFVPPYYLYSLPWVATQDFAVSLESALPGVVRYEVGGTPVTSTTIPTGETSSTVSIRALRTGQTAVVVDGDGVESTTSTTIQVVN